MSMLISQFNELSRPHNFSLLIAKDINHHQFKLAVAIHVGPYVALSERVIRFHIIIIILHHRTYRLLIKNMFILLSPHK